MIDATYKTTRYDLACFLFVLELMSGSYMVIAEFIVQAETSELISEALNVSVEIMESRVGPQILYELFRSRI